MGKTKIKTIDDSKPVEQPVKKAVKKVDSLVESLKKELGIEDQSSVVSEPVKTDKQKTAKLGSEDRKQKTDNRIKPRSKKYQEKAQLVDKSQAYKINEAVELALKSSYTKFPGSIEVHINTSQKNLRGFVSLPYSTGRKQKDLAFGQGAKQSGTDIAGDSDLQKSVAELKGGKTEYEQSSKILYETEPNGQVIHMLIGKADQEPQEILANIKAVYNVLGRSKIKKMTLSPTMGAGVKVELSSI